MMVIIFAIFSNFICVAVHFDTNFFFSSESFTSLDFSQEKRKKTHIQFILVSYISWIITHTHKPFNENKSNFPHFILFRFSLIFRHSSFHKFYFFFFLVLFCVFDVDCQLMFPSSQLLHRLLLLSVVVSPESVKGAKIHTHTNTLSLVHFTQSEYDLFNNFCFSFSLFLLGVAQQQQQPLFLLPILAIATNSMCTALNRLGIAYSYDIDKTIRQKCLDAVLSLIDSVIERLKWLIKWERDRNKKENRTAYKWDWMNEWMYVFDVINRDSKIELMAGRIIHFRWKTQFLISKIERTSRKRKTKSKRNCRLWCYFEPLIPMRSDYLLNSVEFQSFQIRFKSFFSQEVGCSIGKVFVIFFFLLSLSSLI